MSVEKLFVGCDMEVPYEGAFAAGAYINDATVTYAIKDKGGATVEDGTGVCAYVADSDGNYLGEIDAAVTGSLVWGQRYTVEITMVRGNDKDFRVIECLAVYRGEE